MDSQLSQSTQLAASSDPRNKPIVVGLYGVPGSGKTFLLNRLKEELGQSHFAFYEGSQVIESIVPGGLCAFQTLKEQEKTSWRERAIDKIGQACAESGQVAVVAGHFMFWSEEEETGQSVYTQKDLDTYTHILYLDVPPEVVVKHRLSDTERRRPSASVNHLYKWQLAEKTQLHSLCHRHGILFSSVSPRPVLFDQVSMLLHDFRCHTEEQNLSCAERMLDEFLAAKDGQLETVLALDADRTLAAEDTGILFWNEVACSRQLVKEENPLKTLFSSSLGYSYTAFRQATLLYEEVADVPEFEALCEKVASAVTVHADFKSLLQLVAQQQHVRAILLTSGLRRVWEKVLEKEGLSQTVKVIGGGRLADGFVVTAAVKRALVGRLRDTSKVYVLAFGDSPLDLPMLREADQAIIVVGEEQLRSKAMDAALSEAIDQDGLQARQVLLPSHASPRLDTTKLPLLRLTDCEFIRSVLCRRNRRSELHVLHATDKNAAKLLMTPTRNATLSGPALREAHRRVGWYLATEFLADVVGVEEHPIPHVQGHQTSGHRLLHERNTSIVALMRGGEAMAFGVSDAFPLAMFIHASSTADVKPQHLQDQHAVVLVDSVINSGKTVIQFVEHVRSLHPTIRIVVLAGVAQAQSISGSEFAQAMARVTQASLIALRLSDNKFTGRGTTDTGNRLYNTTHLP